MNIFSELKTLCDALNPPNFSPKSIRSARDSSSIIPQLLSTTSSSLLVASLLGFPITNRPETDNLIIQNLSIVYRDQQPIDAAAAMGDSRGLVRLKVLGEVHKTTNTNSKSSTNVSPRALLHKRWWLYYLLHHRHQRTPARSQPKVVHTCLCRILILFLALSFYTTPPAAAADCDREITVSESQNDFILHRAKVEPRKLRRTTNRRQ